MNHKVFWNSLDENNIMNYSTKTVIVNQDEFNHLKSIRKEKCNDIKNRKHPIAEQDFIELGLNEFLIVATERGDYTIKRHKGIRMMNLFIFEVESLFFYHLINALSKKEQKNTRDRVAYFSGLIDPTTFNWVKKAFEEKIRENNKIFKKNNQQLKTKVT